MAEFLVTATNLNLRSAPVLSPSNIVALLPHGTRLEVGDPSSNPWWRASVTRGAQQLSGFCAAKYLKADNGSTASPTHGSIGGVDLPKHPLARRDSTSFRHCPLGEPGTPSVATNLSGAARVAALYGLVEFLDVLHSRRYQRTEHATFCNIYAYDYCHCAGAVLPRVWWTQKALLALARKESVAVEYSKTVVELNANALHDWLREWGQDFGWQEAATPTQMQERVNEGRVGVVCAKRRDVSRSGHITCVLPETGTHAATRQGSSVIGLLQSQAGATNKPYFQNAWWNSSEYSSFGFWFTS